MKLKLLTVEEVKRHRILRHQFDKDDVEQLNNLQEKDYHQLFKIKDQKGKFKRQMKFIKVIKPLHSESQFEGGEVEINEC